MVSGKGKRKSPEQKEWEKWNHLCQQWRKYEEQLKIMGDDRNSYSKTDHDATFMRTKEPTAVRTLRAALVLPENNKMHSLNAS